MSIRLSTTTQCLLEARSACASRSMNGTVHIEFDLLHRIITDAAHAHDFHALINTPHTANFLDSVKLEAAHQRDRWGYAHDRSKSAENWFWLVGYLAGKCLRACITGDRDKALHHTVSSAAALANWHEAIRHDATGAGVGADTDIKQEAP